MRSSEIDNVKIVESNIFRKQFLGVIAYILIKFNDEFVAESVVDDYSLSLSEIKLTLDSNTGIIDDARLSPFGYRRKLLKRHKYAIIYRYENGVVYLDYFFHQSQDYLSIMKQNK